MKVTHALFFGFIAFLPLSGFSQAQYAGTYYGELDEQIAVFGHIVQPREKTNNVTATITTSGDLTITGISEVTGTVDNEGNIIITNDGGFGFTDGLIEGYTIHMVGTHSQDGGTRMNTYWIAATENTPVSASFPDAVAEPNNWNYTPWFGYFNGINFPWIYHQTLGLLYVSGTDDTTLWVWYEPLQYMATNETNYPWFYSTFLDAWLFYDISIASPQWFYNTNTSEWFYEVNPN